MRTLADAEAALHRARAAAQDPAAPADPARLPAALIDFAEAAPLFRYRAAPVTAALLEAVALLPPLHLPALEIRCLVRLSEARMQEGDGAQALKLAEQAVSRALAAADEEGGAERVLRAQCQRARALRRLGEGRAEEADQVLLAAAAELPRLRRAGGESFIAVSLAIAEGQLERGDADAAETLRALLRGLDQDGLEAPDARFAAHQGIALCAELSGQRDRATAHLRDVVSLVKRHDAPLDLLEARLALGAALSAARKSAEARRVLQVVVDEARDLSAEHHRLLGLTALSTVLSQQGAVRGAVDLAIESASGYARLGSLLGYVRGVALAAHALLGHNRTASAIEIMLYGVSALRHTMGEQAASLLQAQLDALRAELGEERYEEACRELLALRAARQRVSES